MTYSIIGILAAIILLITNRDVLWKVDRAVLTSTQKSYRKFLFGVMAYYITDMLWGILESHNLTAVLYADTVVHFIAMAAAVMLWTRYVVIYLEDKKRFGSLLYYAGGIFLICEVIVVIINFFYPVLFWFDESGAYHAGILRYVTLAIQIILFLMTSAYTMSVTGRT